MEGEEMLSDGQLNGNVSLAIKVHGTEFKPLHYRILSDFIYQIIAKN